MGIYHSSWRLVFASFRTSINSFVVCGSLYLWSDDERKKIVVMDDSIEKCTRNAIYSYRFIYAKKLMGKLQ